jgi:hypothetical protein
VLHDELVERHLAVAGHGELTVAQDRADRRRANLGFNDAARVVSEEP